MYVNKFEVNGETKFDLTKDTIAPASVRKGVTFHDKSGAPQEGSAEELGGIQEITFNEQSYQPDETGNVTINEEDPTVPEWSKNPVKPTYEASEVNAVGVEDTIELVEIDNMFNAVFG